ncbi:MAG: bacterioferritin [Candidatus Thiodiazotropha sp.]
MKGESQILQALNRALKDQITAINQLFLHARIARNWGLEGLNDTAYDRSIKAMKMADSLIERILFLEGLPNLQDPGKLMIGENPQEMLAGDLKILTSMHQGLREAVAVCEGAHDFVSRDLLEEILETCESHIDWLETQQWLIEHSGLENYLQSQMGGE